MVVPEPERVGGGPGGGRDGEHAGRDDGVASCCGRGDLTEMLGDDRSGPIGEVPRWRSLSPGHQGAHGRSGRDHGHVGVGEQPGELGIGRGAYHRLSTERAQTDRERGHRLDVAARPVGREQYPHRSPVR